MEKKKISWFKRSLVIPAALFAMFAFGNGCKTTGGLDEPSFLRQYSKPAAAAKTESGAPAKKESDVQSTAGKNYPLKFYLSGKGTFAEDFARANGGAKIVISPSEALRIPIYISGSYSESEQDDGETLVSKVLRGGAGLGGYVDLSEDVKGYAEGSFIAEGTNYDEDKDFDLDMTRCYGVGKVGFISKSLDLKVLLSGGFSRGEYFGKIGTADLEDSTKRGFVSLKGKMKIAGKGQLASFDGDDEESNSNEQESNKEQGLYGLAGIAYDEQELEDLVKGRIPSAMLGLEFRDTVGGMPYFVRLIGTARREEYLYPYAKDKKDEYFGGALGVGLKFCPFGWLTLEGGYDGEQHGYGAVGMEFSLGVRPKKHK